MAKILAASFLGATLLAAAPGAQAASSAKMRDLLGQGFQVRAVSVISEAVARRMADNSKWADDLMITLQKGTQLAFCHAALGMTLTQGTAFLDGPCSVEH